MEWLTIALTLTGLAVGGHHFVVGAAATGKRCGMSPALIGATIVALGTSLPEWGVSVAAAWRGFTDLSVGNVVGSNVCNVCLILGLAAALSPIPITRECMKLDGSLMLLSTVLFLAVCAGGVIGRVEGALLLALGLATTAFFVATRRDNSDAETLFHWWDVPRTLGSLGLVLISSHFFVEAAEGVARRLGVSEWTIGITIAALGTSLPELVTTLAAVCHKQTAMVIGNILGSNTFNILFVLGSAATIQPLGSEHFEFWPAAIFAGLMILVHVFLWTGLTITRREGASLVALGSVWYALEFVV